MIKKPQDKKKKFPSSSNLFTKTTGKDDKIKLKFALNLHIAQPLNILTSPKPNESVKNIKSTTATPKTRAVKKSVK